MIFADLKNYLTKIGLATTQVDVNGQTYLVVGLTIPAGLGSHAGETCEIALRETHDNPWIPEPKIHTKPHLTAMGEKASLASELGSDWQYLSRRFDKPPTPKTFWAHVLTVLGEL